MTSDDERLRRWRLILGGHEAEGTGRGLSGADLSIDKALDALYGGGGAGGLAAARTIVEGAWAPRRPMWPVGWGTSGRSSPARSSG